MLDTGEILGGRPLDIEKTCNGLQKKTPSRLQYSRLGGARCPKKNHVNHMGHPVYIQPIFILLFIQPYPN